MVRWRQKFQEMQNSQATRSRGLWPCSSESCSLVVLFLTAGFDMRGPESGRGRGEAKGDLLQSFSVTTWSSLRLEAALVAPMRGP